MKYSYNFEIWNSNKKYIRTYGSLKEADKFIRNSIISGKPIIKKVRVLLKDKLYNSNYIEQYYKIKGVAKLKLRVSHYPQIPCKPFVISVESLKEAKKIFDVLADYDLFQFNNKIKPDYANATVLEYWDEEEQEWLSWCDEETDIDNLDEYFEHMAMKNSCG